VRKKINQRMMWELRGKIIEGDQEETKWSYSFGSCKDRQADLGEKEGGGREVSSPIKGSEGGISGEQIRDIERKICSPEEGKAKGRRTESTFSCPKPEEEKGGGTRLILK